MAFRPKRLLLASDFEESTRAAEVDAVLLAGAFDAEVKVAHVQPFSWQNSPNLAAIGTRGLEACTQRLRESRVRVLEPELLHGSPAETLIVAAEALAADLIVIGASGRKGVVGATAETVGRFARHPVWIARPRAEPRIQRILCGVDGSPVSENAARDAIALSGALAARLEFAHVADTSDSDLLGSAEPEERLRIARVKQATLTNIDSFLDALGPPGSAAPRRYLSGQPAGVLIRMAHEESFDLVVMGRVGAGGLRRVLLGITAERLLRKLSCGLLLTSPLPSSGS